MLFEISSCLLSKMLITPKETHFSSWPGRVEVTAFPVKAPSVTFTTCSFILLFLQNFGHWWQRTCWRDVLGFHMQVITCLLLLVLNYWCFIKAIYWHMWCAWSLRSKLSHLLNSSSRNMLYLYVLDWLNGKLVGTVQFYSFSSCYMKVFFVVRVLGCRCFSWL